MRSAYRNGCAAASARLIAGSSASAISLYPSGDGCRPSGEDTRRSGAPGAPTAARVSQNAKPAWRAVHRLQLPLDRFGGPALINLVHAGDDDNEVRRRQRAGGGRARIWSASANAGIGFPRCRRRQEGLERRGERRCSRRGRVAERDDGHR